MCSMNNLSTEIEKILHEELEKSRDAIEKAAEKVAQQTVDRLKQTSPKKTGKYARAWRKKATPLIRGKASYIVHNTRGQLTHLLEKGHALKSGGRTRAFPHIKPAEEEAIKNFERELIDLIERG